MMVETYPVTDEKNREERQVNEEWRWQGMGKSGTPGEMVERYEMTVEGNNVERNV